MTLNWVVQPLAGATAQAWRSKTWMGSTRRLQLGSWNGKATGTGLRLPLPHQQPQQPRCAARHLRHVVLPAPHLLIRVADDRAPEFMRALLEHAVEADSMKASAAAVR